MVDDDIRRSQFNALLYEWLADRKRAGLSDATRHKYKEAVGSFYAWCHSREEQLMLGDVTRQDVITWRDDEIARYSASTVNQRLSALRSFYDFLLERDLISRNPAHRLPGASKRVEKQDHRGELTDLEVSALLRPWSKTEAAIRDLAIIHLMAYCALRTSEVSRLDFEDVAGRGGRVLLWVWGRGRAAPDQSIIVPAPAEEALRAWLLNRPGEQGGPLFTSLSRRDPGRRLSVGYIRKMVKRRMHRVGVKGDKSPESIRLAAIKNAIRRGGDPVRVRRMARHKKLETTLDYYREQAGQPVGDLISYEPESDD